MQYDVRIGERVRQVVVQRAGEAWTVTVDGASFVVQVAPVDGAASSLLVGRLGEGAPSRSVPVVVVPDRASGGLAVHVNGRQMHVMASESGRRRRRGAGGHGEGPQRLTAPMPGRIVRVLASVGDTVQAGHGLVVVEAMKMENILKAERDGKVQKINAKAGDSLAVDAVIMEFA